jgi:hypothetical protein
MPAAAYAEKGDFEYAGFTARAALAAAGVANEPTLAAQIEGRVARYLSRQPFRGQ